MGRITQVERTSVRYEIEISKWRTEVRSTTLRTEDLITSGFWLAF